MQKMLEMQCDGKKRALVVSIHDVSPRTRVRTQVMLEDLARIGVGRVSLLVIPDHHGRGRISDDEGFSRWLREKCADGHEAVLHGYYHRRAAKSADGAWKRVVAQCYTAGEGEFLDLPQPEVRELLERGRAELEACGVKSRGFIAPAWLLGDEAEQAVRAAGFEYTTRIGTVSDFAGGQEYGARSLVWSVRARWRCVCSLAWNAVLARREHGNALMRIGLHPPDWEHAAIRQQILRICGGVLAERTANTYDGWLDHIRSQE